MSALPVIVRDPRFAAGRSTVGNQASVDIFATLLQQTEIQYGAGHFETAPGYYEYGNALFRLAQRKELTEEMGAEEEEEQKTASSSREAAAVAAERRANKQSSSSAATDDAVEEKKPAAKEDDGDDNDDKKDDTSKENAAPDEDVLLALEMMATAYSILEHHAKAHEDEDADAPPPSEIAAKYAEWIRNQLPRVLSGIGDVLSALGRHPDAVDFYFRALEHRQNLLEEAIETTPSDDTTERATKLLTCRRLVVETYALIAEELLACDLQQDVVTTETQMVLVKAGEVVEYAMGYYEQATDELQKAAELMGKMMAGQVNVGEETVNLRLAASMLKGVGESLTGIDEAANNDAFEEKEPKRKKAKSS